MLILNIGILFFQHSTLLLSLGRLTSHLGKKVAFFIAFFFHFIISWDFLDIPFFINSVFHFSIYSCRLWKRCKIPFSQSRTFSFFFFALCLFNSCFAFWSNWTTKLANTVISVTQISSTGYVAGKPVNALDSFLFPGMGCMSLKALRVLLFWYFYQKFRLPFCVEKAESKISRELHLRLLKNKQHILILLWFRSRHWWGSCFHICVVAWLSLPFLYWTFASRFSCDYPFSYAMRAGQTKHRGSYTTYCRKAYR